MTEAEVRKVLAGTPKRKRKSVACALVGHSKMLEPPCFDYWSCGRCGTQIGDSLGGAFSVKDAVIQNHGCPTCHENAKALTWEDRIFMPAPTKWIGPIKAAKEGA